MPELHKALKTLNHYVFTLKMATAMFDETLNNSQHSTLAVAQIRRCTLNSFPENFGRKSQNGYWKSGTVGIREDHCVLFRTHSFSLQ
jgi:hypothetical protein